MLQPKKISLNALSEQTENILAQKLRLNYVCCLAALHCPFVSSDIVWKKAFFRFHSLNAVVDATKQMRLRVETQVTKRYVGIVETKEMAQ